MIKLQEGAVKHLKELTEKHSKPYVRLSIKGGGCAGFGYDWSFEEQPSAKDFVIDNLLLIDKIFELYLLGMELDYKHEIFGSQFVFNNPKAKSSCGCGTSFSI